MGTRSRPLGGTGVAATRRPWDGGQRIASAFFLRPRFGPWPSAAAEPTAQSVAFNSVSSLASTVAGEVLFLARRFFVLSIIFFGRFVGCRVFPFSDGVLVVAVVVFLFSFLASFFLPSFTEFPAAGQDWVLFT